MPVTTIEVEPRSVPISVEVMAQTEGARETEVRARVSGILIERLYQEGQEVEKGQPLFQIDRSTYENAYAESKARAERTAREINRLKGLLATKAVSQKTYDDAVSDNEIAQAELRQARLNLSWTTVRAPVAGTTGRAVKSVGNLISVGADSLLTSIYQLNPIRVRFSLAESDIAKLPEKRLDVEKISGVEVTLPDGQVISGGRLNFVSSTIDPQLGTRQLRAEFDNADGRLLPGQFVRARLQFGERDGVFLVPQPAVMQNAKGYIVMLAGEGDTVTPRPVQTAGWHGSDWVITGGLQPGDRVIVDNLIKLRPGMPVTPKPPQSAPAEEQKPADAESDS
ncbi:MAG: efflux RND transporter periplasmic adaptor subunit [Pseudomonadota bacterium]